MLKKIVDKKYLFRREGNFRGSGAYTWLKLECGHEKTVLTSTRL